MAGSGSIKLDIKSAEVSKILLAARVGRLLQRKTSGTERGNMQASTEQDP
jgi:hypothetical protein